MIKLNKLIGLKEKLFNERGEIEKIIKEQGVSKEKEVVGVNGLIKGMVGSM
jgi:hypothetical protein